MKKMKFVKIACAVLTMCLITTCAIGTTLAKYTTGSSASDTARVAKWGVEVSASGTMFGKAYQDTIVADGAENATVQSNNWATYSKKVVAPGTLNDTGIQIKLKGKPEVDFNFFAEITDEAEDIYLKANTYGVMVEAYGINPATDFTAEELYTLDTTGTYTRANGFTASTTYYRLTDYVEVTADYYPIVWTGTITATDTDGVGSGTKSYTTLAAALAEGLVGGINALGDFEANANVDLVYKLTWAWNIDNGEKNGDVNYSNKCDTILGNLMAAAQGGYENTVVKFSDASTSYVPVEAEDYSLDVGCGFSVRATQID